jgi:mono/diheme cytochrome c family protein
MRAHRLTATLIAAAVLAGPWLFAQPAEVALPPGDAARGKAIFEGSRGNCVSCHRVGEVGSLYGPDLSTIGAPRGGGAAGGRGGAAGGRGGQGAAAPPAPPPPLSQQFAQSILDPNAVVTVQNRYVRLTMNDGKTVWGKLLNLDTFAVQIFDSTEKLRNIPRTDVREMTMTSPMPSYRDRLTARELADVVEYLVSLKGQ